MRIQSPTENTISFNKYCYSTVKKIMGLASIVLIFHSRFYLRLFKIPEGLDNLISTYGGAK